jgi:hypothetical protein
MSSQGNSRIIHVLLSTSVVMKLYHWQTHSHARHIASDRFNEAFSGLMDRFVETYMGKYGRVQLGRTTPDIKAGDTNDESIKTFLVGFVQFMSNELPTLLKPTDTDLLNLRDEMIGLVNQTLYLFTLS